MKSPSYPYANLGHQYKERLFNRLLNYTQVNDLINRNQLYEKLFMDDCITLSSFFLELSRVEQELDLSNDKLYTSGIYMPALADYFKYKHKNRYGIEMHSLLIPLLIAFDAEFNTLKCRYGISKEKYDKLLFLLGKIR